MIVQAALGALELISILVAFAIAAAGIAFPWIAGRFYPEWVDSHQPVVGLLWPVAMFAGFFIACLIFLGLAAA